MSTKKSDKLVAPAKKEAAIKQVNSTDASKAQADATADQVEAAQSQTPVGIDFTDPKQRKKDEEDARAQNEKDFKAVEGSVQLKK
jgi:hypothetical protein